MHVVTHLLVSWSVANVADLDRRSRTIVTLAGIAPDADGLVIVPDFLTRHTDHHLAWWTTYHHTLGHNVGFSILVAVLAVCLARRRRWTTMALALVTFHLHLFCDIIGSRGPDGNPWPIPYLLPFSGAWQWTWEGQWALNAWPNFLITIVFLLLMFYLAWKQGHSILEIVSSRADRGLVEALRRRFGKP